jgi:hypothetical protein
MQNGQLSTSTVRSMEYTKMDIQYLLEQIISQNKTRIFRVDFLPTADLLAGKNPTKLVGIKKPSQYADEINVYNFLDHATYTVPLSHITQMNIRKFQLEV